MGDTGADDARTAADLPRGRPRRRQDVRHARGGPPPARARHRRRRRPFVETHGRAYTADLLAGLEVVPRRTMELPRHDLHRDGRRRRPGPAARRSRWSTSWPTPTSPARATPSGGRTSRSCSTPGITVLSTVNIQHLESLNDVVEQITGVPQRETVPDEVVRARRPGRAGRHDAGGAAPADGARQRLPAEKVDAALGNYFRIGNLTALRELALLWLADKVDDQLDRYRAEHHIDATWEARERVVVALTGGPEGDTLIRRAARIAARGQGRRPAGRARHPQRRPRRRRPGHCWPGSGSSSRASAAPTTRSSAPTSPRPCSTSPAASTPPSSCSAPAAAAGSRRSSRRGVGVTTTAESGPIDVHLVTHERGRARAAGAGAARRRAVAGRAGSPGSSLAAGRPAAADRCCCSRFGDDLSLASDILLFLAAVVGVALVGGLWPALVAAVVGFLLLNYFFTPPVQHVRPSPSGRTCSPWSSSWSSPSPSARSSTSPPAAPARRPRAGAEAQTLATVAGSVLRGDRPLTALLRAAARDVRADRRHAAGAAGRARGPDGRSATPTPGGSSPASAARRATAPATGTSTCRSATTSRSCSAAGRWPPSDRRVVEAFAAQAAVALRQERLAERGRRRRDRSPRPTGCAPRCSPPSATTCAPRWPSAKAAVTSLRSHRRRRSPTPTAPSCSPPPTSRWTGSTGWSRTCST